MPQLKNDHPRSRPWQAIVKRDGIRIHVGYFETREEAEEAEAGFNSIWPRKKNQYA